MRSPQRRSGVRTAPFVLLCAVLCTVVAVLGLGRGAGASPKPPAPSAAPPLGIAAPSAVASAEKQARDANQKLSTLSRRITAQTRRVHALAQAADHARARYSAQLEAVAQAGEQARTATAIREQAERDYDLAHARFIQMVRGGVMESGNPVADTAYAVFNADSPDAVIDALEVGSIVRANESGLVDDLTAAVGRRRAAEKAQQEALDRQRVLAGELAGDARDADTALSAARSGLERLRAEIAKAKRSQAAAVLALSQVLGGWSLADPEQAAALNARYRELAARAAALPRPKNPGHWTLALGQYAANRALAWISTPYAWAGGNAAGPTRGVCAGGDAAADCHIVGFDCSGLALYAWAPFKALPHLAATQYTVAGTEHPQLTELMPGDLVFWSDNGRASGIHHVAIYIGDGNVVQAPQSGDIVRVTPLGRVDSGYFGATRPMS